MDKLRSTKKIVVTIKYDTKHNPNYMKIYSHYAIDIKLVGDFNYKVDANEF